MSCRRMLSVKDRSAIMVGLEAGLSQVRIARSIGRSPSVMCREIVRHRGPSNVYKAQGAGRAAQVTRRHPKKTLIDHGICRSSRRWMRKNPLQANANHPLSPCDSSIEAPRHCRPDDPRQPERRLHHWKRWGLLVKRTTRYLIIVALPLRRRADQVCDALTRRIQGLPEGAMRTLTWDQGPEMARHQRLTPGTGVEVFFAHPHSPWERGTNENTNRLIRRYLPKGTPHHQPPTLPRHHRLRAGQLPQSNPRLLHPHSSIQPTHCYHPLTPPTAHSKLCASQALNNLIDRLIGANTPDTH